MEDPSLCWGLYSLRTGVLAYWRTSTGVLAYITGIHLLAYWRTGILAYWRTGVHLLAYWHTGVHLLAYWRTGVMA
jgi:hypothetical protein